MIPKIKQGNSVPVKFTVMKNGEQKDMTAATGLSWNIRHAEYGCRRLPGITVVGGSNPYTIVVNTTAASPLGVYFISLSYLMGGESRSVDAAAFELTAHSSACGCQDPDKAICLLADTCIGVDGVGVPAGGTTGQVLAKASDGDFATEWSEPAPARREVVRLARTTPQPVVKEIMHDVLLFRPKGHVFYVAPGADKMQIAGVLPHRGAIRTKGRLKDFTEAEHEYAVPVFDPRYVESVRYTLRWNGPAGELATRNTLSGEIRLKLKPDALPERIALILYDYLDYDVRMGDTVVYNIIREQLRSTGGEVVIRLRRGRTMHIRILAAGLDEMSAYSGKYLRVDEDMGFVPVGTPESTRPPYLGRINPRSEKTARYPGEGLYARIVSPERFVEGLFFYGSQADNPQWLVQSLGFSEALDMGYRLFARMGSKRGPVYRLMSTGDFSMRFGEAAEPHLSRSNPQATTLKRKYFFERLGRSAFRVDWIDCSIARPRLHKGVDDEVSYCMDRNYPRFDFRVRAVMRSRYNPDTRKADEIYQWQAQK